VQAAPAEPLFGGIVPLAPAVESLVFVWSVVAMITTSCAIRIAHSLDVIGETHLGTAGIVGDAIGWSGSAENVPNPQRQVNKGLEDLIKRRGLAFQ